MSEYGSEGSELQPRSPYDYPAEQVFQYGKPDLEQILGSFDAAKHRFKGKRHRLECLYAMDIHLGFMLHTWIHAQALQMEPLELTAIDEVVEYIYGETQQKWQNVPEADTEGIGKYLRLKAMLDGIYHSPRHATPTEAASMFYADEEQFTLFGYLQKAPVSFSEIAAWRPNA